MSCCVGGELMAGVAALTASQTVSGAASPGGGVGQHPEHHPTWLPTARTANAETFTNVMQLRPPTARNDMSTVQTTERRAFATTNTYQGES